MGTMAAFSAYHGDRDGVGWEDGPRTGIQATLIGNFRG
jgi:hypothetical protein